MDQLGESDQPARVHFVCLVPGERSAATAPTFKIMVWADVDREKKMALPYGTPTADSEYFEPSAFEWIDAGVYGQIALRICKNEDEPYDLLYDFDTKNHLVWRPLSDFVHRMSLSHQSLEHVTLQLAYAYIFPYLERNHPAVLYEVQEAVRRHLQAHSAAQERMRQPTRRVDTSHLDYSWCHY